MERSAPYAPGKALVTADSLVPLSGGMYSGSAPGQNTKSKRPRLGATGCTCVCMHARAHALDRNVSRVKGPATLEQKQKIEI